MVKKNKIDLTALIIFGVLIVSIIMVIVGVCIAWISTKATLLGSSEVATSKLSELADANSKSKEGIEGFGAMQAFAYITLVLTILTAIVFVVSKFVDVKILKWVVLGVAALTIVSAIVAIATSFGFCNKYTNTELGALASSKTSPAAGAWLATIFGIIGGAAGVFGALKK